MVACAAGRGRPPPRGHPVRWRPAPPTQSSGSARLQMPEDTRNCLSRRSHKGPARRPRVLPQPDPVPLVGAQGALPRPAQIEQGALRSARGLQEPRVGCVLGVGSVWATRGPGLGDGEGRAVGDAVARSVGTCVGCAVREGTAVRLAARVSVCDAAWVSVGRVPSLPAWCWPVCGGGRHGSGRHLAGSARAGSAARAGVAEGPARGARRWGSGGHGPCGRQRLAAGQANGCRQQ
jgi:hypothetical protein